LGAGLRVQVNAGARVWLAANPWAWQLGLAVLAGLLVARILFRVFFGDWDDLREAMRLDAQSDWLFAAAR